MKQHDIIISEFENLKIVAGTLRFFDYEQREKPLPRVNKIQYLHRHVYYEIFLIGNSPLNMFTENSERTYENKILIVPPTLGHNGFSSYDDVYTITVSENEGKPNGRLANLKREDVTVLDLTDGAKDYFDKLLQAKRSSSLDKIKCECLVKLILAEVFQLLDEKREQNLGDKYKEKNLYAEQIDQYVNTHYIGSGGSLKELADKMFLSVRQTSRLIKKIYGCTFPQIINQRRMEVASVLLKNSDYTIGEIITLLGFETDNYFFYTFKKNYGESPLQYRKKFCDQKD